MPEMPIESFVPNWGGEPEEVEGQSEDEAKLKRSKIVAALLGAAAKPDKTGKSTTRPRGK